MKLYQDTNTRKAFVMYIIGSVKSWGICQHNLFDSQKGLQWAKQIIESAFWLVTEKICDSHTRAGSFSIYKGQELTPENRVYMDLFEALIYGDNNADRNRAEDLPKEVTLSIALSIHTIYRLLTSNTTSERKEKAEGAKAYDELFKEIDKTAAEETPDYSRGIGWLKFYVNWRFPLGFVFGALSIISMVGEGVNNGFFSIPLFVGLFVSNIALYIFRIYVYSEMRHMTKSGYNANLVLLVLETIHVVYTSASGNGSDWLNYFVFMLPLAFLIWWLPNFVYFSHRKHLFTGMLSIKELAADYNAPNNNNTQKAEEGTQNKASDKKYYCTACGEKSTGWYQTCPYCGAIGKMEKISSLHEAEIDNSITSKQVLSDPSAEAPVLFCRECGRRLNPGAMFCSECGTPISIVKSQTSQSSAQEGHDTISLLPTPTVQEDLVTIDLHDRKLSPTLRRAFLFAEDSEWDRAEEYLEKVLDEEPEDAYAYLGKLLVEIKATGVEQLKEHTEEIRNSKNYSRALRYAEGDLKQFLDRV